MESLSGLDCGGCEFVGRGVGGLQLHTHLQAPLMPRSWSKVVVGSRLPSSALRSPDCRDTGGTAMEQCHVQPTLLNSSFHLHSAQISVFTIRFGSIYFLK